jgi:hypothetical protein
LAVFAQIAVGKEKHGNDLPIGSVGKGYLKNSGGGLCEVGLIKMERIWGCVIKTIFQVAFCALKGYLKNIAALQAASLVD